MNYSLGPTYGAIDFADIFRFHEYPWSDSKQLAIEMVASRRCEDSPDRERRRGDGMKFYLPAEKTSLKPPPVPYAVAKHAI